MDVHDTEERQSKDWWDEEHILLQQPVSDCAESTAMYICIVFSGWGNIPIRLVWFLKQLKTF